MPSSKTETDLYSLFTRSTGVSTDSRKVGEGNIFFALRGDNFDGNRFAADALARGAAWAVVDDASVATSDRYIVVDNTLTTLQEMASRHRRRLAIPIMAITGTNGKTTTKELIAGVLAERVRVSATAGNLNNHIGVPLTLLGMNTETDIGIVEMGASGVGERAALCAIAQPDLGLIPTLGRAHLEGFGSEENIRKAKGELYDYLAEHGGTAFYRESDPILAEMVAARPDLDAIAYSASLADGMDTHLTGSYNKFNIAAAVAVGWYFDLPREESAHAVESYIPDNSRSQRVETADNTLIVDCYNANPSSMSAAIDAFAALPSERTKAVILGDMLELGAYAASEHAKILTQVRQAGISEMYLVGDNFARAAQDTDAHLFKDAAALAAYLTDHPLRNRTILLKGSNGIRLDTVKDKL
jgi:UDP-N-acetylmuramoyl-tripeptide--D-alanyl-D-alanine ligase